jgi:hypothetical protein
MREYAKKKKQEKKIDIRFSYSCIFSFIERTFCNKKRATEIETENVRWKLSTRTREKEKKRAKEICIYLCYCLYVDRLILLLNLVPSIDIQCRKFCGSVFQLLFVLVSYGDDNHSHHKKECWFLSAMNNAMLRVTCK